MHKILESSASRVGTKCASDDPNLIDRVFASPYCCRYKGLPPYITDKMGFLFLLFGILSLRSIDDLDNLKFGVLTAEILRPQSRDFFLRMQTVHRDQ